MPDTDVDNPDAPADDMTLSQSRDSTDHRAICPEPQDESSDDTEFRTAEDIRSLAREMSRHSTFLPHEPASLFHPEPESDLDPNSPSFSPHKWVKTLLRVEDSDPNVGPRRKVGSAFRNLNVHGYAEGADYQKTVANVALSILQTGRRIIGQAGERVSILRDFEGVVEVGEMLVVLGPPGSGCTTLLRTIAGETDGITVDEQSEFNYQGKQGPNQTQALSLTSNRHNGQSHAPPVQRRGHIHRRK